MNKQEIINKIKEAVQADPYYLEIQKVSLFGSQLGGNAKIDSDVDVLIEFSPNAKIGFFKLARIKRNMEAAVKKEIDLLTPEALSKFFRTEVIKEAEIIYEK